MPVGEEQDTYLASELAKLGYQHVPLDTLTALMWKLKVDKKTEMD